MLLAWGTPSIYLYAIGIVPHDVFVTDRLGNPVNLSFIWDNPGLMGGGDTPPPTNTAATRPEEVPPTPVIAMVTMALTSTTYPSRTTSVFWITRATRLPA